MNMTRDMNIAGQEATEEDRFIVISFGFMNKLVKKFGCCADCQNELNWEIKSRKGYAHQFVLHCAQCRNEVFNEYTCEQVTKVTPSGTNHQHYTVNNRMVFAAQQNSIHLKKLNSFTGIAGIEGGLAGSAYTKILSLVFEMNKETIGKSMAQSRDRVKKELGLKVLLSLMRLIP